MESVNTGSAIKEFTAKLCGVLLRWWHGLQIQLGLREGVREAERRAEEVSQTSGVNPQLYDRVKKAPKPPRKPSR